MATRERLLCAPCKSRSISATALKVCRTCRESLCKNCIECHKTFKATKDHQLDQFVQHKNLKITCADLVNLQMCTQHPNKQTEFYCDSHRTLLCSLCLLKSENHKNCAKIIEIESAGISFLKSKFTDNVIDACFKTSESAGYTITEIEKSKECASESLKVLRSEIESIRSKMLEAFDRQTNHIIQTISSDLLDNSSKCEQAIMKLRSIGKSVKEREILIKNAIDNGAKGDVFRGVISILGQCEYFQKEIEQIRQNCSRQNVTFERSDLVHVLETDQNPLLFCNVEKVALQLPNVHTNRLEMEFKKRIALIPNDIVSKDIEQQHLSAEMVDSKSGNGRLPTGSTHDMKTSSSDAEIEEGFRGSASDNKLQSYLDIEVSYCESFDVVMSDDENPWFGGIVCLPDDRLILSDSENLRLIMVENNTYVSEKDIEFIPGNITLFNQLLVVCLMKTNKLLLMKIEENGLKEYRYLRTRYNPKCVQAVDNERILVSSKKGRDAWHLELLVLQGQNWRSTAINVHLSGHYDGYKLAVQHVPDLHDGFRLIQCCEESDKVQCFNEVGGPPLFHYEAENTTSVITDHLGFIFITRYPGEVHVLSPEGNFVTSIHRNAMQRIKFSAFNKSMDKLFLTTNKDSKIHVLDVKRGEFVKL